MTVPSKIQSAISDLTAATEFLRKYAQTPLRYKSSFKTPGALRSSSLIRSPFKIDSIELAQRIWANYLVDQLHTAIPKRTLRVLCSISDVALTPEFAGFLSKYRAINFSMLHSLLSIYHLHWSDRNRITDLESIFPELLTRSSGKSVVLEQWRTNVGLMVGARAHVELGHAIALSMQSVPSYLDQLYIDTKHSTFASAVVLVAVEKSCDFLHSKGFTEQRWNLILQQFLPFASLTKSQRAAALAKVIHVVDLHRGERSWADALAQLKDFVLQHPELGDPRISSVSWQDFDPRAREIFVSWLSEEDLTFFFELIIKKDPHSRKRFWLKYVKAMKNSYVLVGESDLSYNSVALNDLRKRGRHFGRGTGIDSSAFIMTFGKYVVVEFSEVGNACYLYKSSDFDDLFGTLKDRRNDLRRLKDRNIAVHVQAHYASWPHALESVLTTHGIYAGRS